VRNLRIKAVLCAVVGLCAVLGLGCHSSGINVTIQNNSKVPLRNVELDYPGAAFGTGKIAPGASYWYHMKPTSDGDLTLSFELPDAKTIRQKQGSVRQGESGRLIIVVDQDANQQWHTTIEKK
jgi:hypothetical protein